MKGLICFNKYYSDSGMQYIESRLKDEFKLLNIQLCTKEFYTDLNNIDALKQYRFALFFDKDIAKARYLESVGIRVFNSSKTIAICDNKEYTYSYVSSCNVTIPKTIVSPLMYDVSQFEDNDFLQYVSKKISLPIVIKQNVGSQGKQVYLAENFTQLQETYSKLKHLPHMYQEFIGDKKGEDIRVYIIGKKAVSCVKRKNTTSFKSNVSLGGKMEIIPLTKELIDYSENIAKKLELDYGSVDFLQDKNNLVFLEANSNAYFKTIEDLGENIARKIAEYISEKVSY